MEISAWPLMAVILGSEHVSISATKNAPDVSRFIEISAANPPLVVNKVMERLKKVINWREQRHLRCFGWNSRGNRGNNSVPCLG